jgi:7-cyano-7-deazaguanine reductase
MQNFKFLGKKATTPSKKLDTFSTPENITYIKFESNELTSFCPVTGQPDFSTLLLEYYPDKLCIESKSLKLYLWSFRDEAIFAEGLANNIIEDVFIAIKPVWCKVSILQNIRGGIQLTAVAEKKKDQKRSIKLRK